MLSKCPDKLSGNDELREYELSESDCTNKQIRMNKHLFIFQFCYVTGIPNDTIFTPI